ncbi:MAG TPA: homocysteine S-methyltransferase family protein [Candidatus Eubacterium faecipullorum]|uniref:Methionine synthase n=1 Tax=Candidatus Eubacterium faecipullorum TaxID=2838571 RepID=A0A9D1RFA6_9FIRM|nr:homocysteine S-methyltransferase family protein [Candidatus Eubacterium faecipullorum]
MDIQFFDGSMGTMLQSAGLAAGELPELLNITDSEKVLAVHRAYAAAGSEYITTNTFGANRLKIKEPEEIIRAGVRLAKSTGKKVALDIGPTGKLLKPMGELDFEEAVDIFAQMINAGKDGSDIVLIETMSDTYEIKAAALAAKENCALPVFVTMIFDEKGRLLTGADVKTAVTMLEGLGVDAIGFNCGLGPAETLPLVEEIRKWTSLPVIVQPNAGLPESVNGKTVYNVSPADFARDMKKAADIGVSYLGGCCGTTPEHIKAMIEACRNIPANVPEKKANSFVSSYSKTVALGKKPVIIGERINPTGKKLFKEALRRNDIEYIIKEGLTQTDAGAHILDVNVGLPEIDEVRMMETAVKSLQGVIPAPLQIDTSNIAALERALRIYNGKPMINSVNGKAENMKAVFPLAKKYGGIVVCLCLDENGIPQSAEGRIKIAEKIINTAAEYGIEKKDLIVDALTMTISTDSSNGKETLKAVDYIRNTLGVNTVLGVSNISFGLPKRDAINTAFFTLALQSGLSAGIINPNSQSMMNAYYSFNALSGLDENCTEYINSVTVPEQSAPAGETTLHTAIVKGIKEDAAKCAAELLKTLDSLDVINNYIIPALDEVGDGFEKNRIFLPQLLMSADSAKAAFDVIKEKLVLSGKKEESGQKIVLATVHGDIHDIGKNIVKVLLSNYGFDVIDLGKDVPEEDVLKAVQESGAKLVGLSALMTTTVPAMEKTIELLHKNTNAKVIVGGAVLTQAYADMIHADHYAKDAMETVRLAQAFFGAGK